jgi:hypothetical protein
MPVNICGVVNHALHNFEDPMWDGLNYFAVARESNNSFATFLVTF